MSLMLFRRTPLCAAVLSSLAALSAHNAFAQQQAASANSAPQTIVVTGNPLGREAGTQATTVLSGDALLVRRAGTLGETLDGLPGVSASGFGPNASRPIIRGLDGERLRLLDNGGGSIDASSLSFDHASATDPLVAERVEVLRGPSALLYGGNATGGVVNSIDNRVPRLAADGLSGRAEVRLGGASRERAGAAVLEGGNNNGLAWHADAYGRDAADQRVPTYTPVDDGDALAPTDRVRNSAARSGGGAVGAGWVSARGYLGASVDTMRSRYGVTVEPDTTIHMQRDRLSLAGEWRGMTGFVSQLSAQGSHSKYEHREIEGSGAVGTTFSSKGDDLRVQAQHAALPLAGGTLSGVFGVQGETMGFSALGEEAFVPTTHTQSQAAFVLEELSVGPAVFSAGVRAEQVRVSSDGDAAGAEEARFGAASTRRFAPRSASLAVHLGGTQGWFGGASLGRTERAPAYHELFANGVHVATAAYERGDPTLATERSVNGELSAGWAQGHHSIKANVYQTRFSRFISLAATGRRITVPGADGEPDGSVPEYDFQSVRATLRGAEVEGRTRLLDAGAAAGGGVSLDMTGSFDIVRGTQTDTGEALPRLAPQRLRAGLQAQGAGGWRAGLTWRHAAAQTRVPVADTATPGYSMVDLWASGPLSFAPGATWFAKLDNATDKLAYNASTVATMRGLAPLPGRALSVGVRMVF